MPPYKTSFKRAGSLFFVSICQLQYIKYFSKLGVIFFLVQKLNRFQPSCLLFFDVAQKPHVTWELTTESTSHSRYIANGRTG